MREEAPTLIIDENGTKRWRNKDGKLHRVGGPAVEYANGNKAWYQMGERYRIDGPAVEYSDGDKSWYLRGKVYRNKEAFFEELTDEEKAIALFSQDFHDA